MPKYTHCQKCGRKVSKRCLLGLCNKCRDRSGDKNPFFGKKHSPEKIKEIKAKLSVISKSLWQDHSYREKVIKGVSKPRRAGFKKEQSERVTEWYKNNPKQISLRSDALKKAWREGRIEPTINSINESKIERELLNEVKQLFPNKSIRKTTIRVGGRWFYPDIRIDDNLIIEFYGDYWHGNPKKYQSDDIIIHGIKASQIWERDAERLKILRENGFKVLVVWQDDYENDRKAVLDKILSLDFR